MIEEYLKKLLEQITRDAITLTFVVLIVILLLSFLFSYVEWKVKKQ